MPTPRPRRHLCSAAESTRPLDPRLLCYSAAARTFFGVGVVRGIVRTAATLTLCWLLSGAISGAINGRSFTELLPNILPLAGVGILRAGTIWAMDFASARGVAAVKSQWRPQLVTGLPQLILTAIATPLVIVAIFLEDVTRGILVVVALPLMPNSLAS